MPNFMHGHDKALPLHVGVENIGGYLDGSKQGRPKQERLVVLFIWKIAGYLFGCLRRFDNDNGFWFFHVEGGLCVGSCGLLGLLK